MILPHRNIGHKGFHIVDYEAKTYVIFYDSMCLCGSKLLFGVDSRMDKYIPEALKALILKENSASCTFRNIMRKG